MSSTCHWNGPAIAGVFFFTSMMAIGYFYNLTFVQLGLVDLGARLVGLDETAVATAMAAFAVLTAAVAVLTGLLLTRCGGGGLVLKLRLAFAVVLVQTLLVAVAPAIRSEALYLVWIGICALAMGVGVPATFGLTVDLIPVSLRGPVAALITAGAFFPAAVFSANWRIEVFAQQMLPLMLGGSLAVGWLAFGRFGWRDRLAEQHRRPCFGQGRFVRLGRAGRLPVEPFLLVALALLFSVFFIDSLGFLRIIDTPTLTRMTWQATTSQPLLAIGAMHVLGALIAGVLYAALDIRTLFAWIFGVFALVHLSYVVHTRVVPESFAGLGVALLYALAVSLYTVVTFALWADLATPRTIGLTTALGVALSGWLSTFLSTALALHWRAMGLPLHEHFQALAALALVCFLVILVSALVRAWRATSTP